MGSVLKRLNRDWALFPIILIGLAFRVWELTRIGLRGDEAVYAGQALLLAGDATMNRFFILFSRGVSNFLLHQVFQTLAFLLFGVSDFVVRALPVFFSTLTIIVVYYLGSKLFDTHVGAVSAFFLAINGYAITLGHLALLDSTMTFFFVLSMYLLVRWIKDEKVQWLYLFACSSALAILMKVTAFLILPLALIIIFFTKQYSKLKLNVLLKALLIFVIALAPAILQFGLSSSTFLSFLSQGTSRVSSVPVTYYLDKLTEYSGVAFLIIALIGITVSLVHHSLEDSICLIWGGGVLLFFQLYPLKGFNYILPVVPVLVLMSSRGLVSIYQTISTFFSKKDGTQKHFRFITILVLLLPSSYFLGYTSVHTIVYDRPFVGLREAAYWLQENIPPDAGVMTISQGSAQYVLSYYARLDAYPFGNFRLHTVLPGGSIIEGAPPPDPLIQNGTITYLVHYVSWGGDDPIHMPVKRPIEELFVELIQKYQGMLLHTIYYQFLGVDGVEMREARVWIYKVGKRLSQPTITVQQNVNELEINGIGFLIDSHVDVYYGNSFLGRFPTDNMGWFNISLQMTNNLTLEPEVVVVDPGRNRGTATLESD